MRAKLLERAAGGNVYLRWKLACRRLGYSETPAVQVTTTATALPTFTVPLARRLALAVAGCDVEVGDIRGSTAALAGA